MLLKSTLNLREKPSWCRWYVVGVRLDLSKDGGWAYVERRGKSLSPRQWDGAPEDLMIPLFRSGSRKEVRFPLRSALDSRDDSRSE